MLGFFSKPQWIKKPTSDHTSRLCLLSSKQNWLLFHAYAVYSGAHCKRHLRGYLSKIHCLYAWIQESVRPAFSNK